MVDDSILFRQTLLESGIFLADSLGRAVGFVQFRDHFAVLVVAAVVVVVVRHYGRCGAECEEGRECYEAVKEKGLVNGMEWVLKKNCEDR